MNTVKVKNVVLGEGRPKICVPMIGRTRDELIQEALQIKYSRADLVEWRIDWFDQWDDMECLKETGKEIRETLNKRPLLITFRSKEEGGEKEITPQKYEELYMRICENHMAEMIDIELMKGDALVKRLVDVAEKAGIVTVGSNHDFYKTPSKEEIINRLCSMQKLGLHITKIAVMPECDRDVLTLLDATLAMKETYADRPFVTMSMSRMGLISRLVGEQFGSCFTFGTVSAASAPGQIGAKELGHILDILKK